MNFLLSLIKMMYWISERSGEALTMNQLEHCLMRNFGGKTDMNNTNEAVELFLKKVRTFSIQTKPSTFADTVSCWGYILMYLPVYFICYTF